VGVNAESVGGQTLVDLNCLLGRRQDLGVATAQPRQCHAEPLERQGVGETHPRSYGAINRELSVYLDRFLRCGEGISGATKPVQPHGKVLQREGQLGAVSSGVVGDKLPLECHPFLSDRQAIDGAADLVQRRPEVVQGEGEARAVRSRVIIGQSPVDCNGLLDRG
jgi:hypothetical protein